MSRPPAGNIGSTFRTQFQTGILQWFMAPTMTQPFLPSHWVVEITTTGLPPTPAPFQTILNILLGPADRHNLTGAYLSHPVKPYPLSPGFTATSWPS